ncbi:MAG TPA: hypothetical protein VFO91_13040 [Anaerolineales bacterium]|nr:hypothetical protein [Anaerolineales bacterium]
MKRIREKLRRTAKYWRVSYQQANGNDRLAIGLFAVTMLVYVWWVAVVV